MAARGGGSGESDFGGDFGDSILNSRNAIGHGKVGGRIKYAVTEIAAAVAVAAALAPNAHAQTSVAPVSVIAATPLPGTGIDIDKAPGSVEVLSAADLALDGSASATGALAGQLSSVSVNDNLDDPYQPDILYRGFEASPVVGTPQGLAVYQNGVRINEAFGDAVNWDLIPDIAIEGLEVAGSNPVFGLNALGGAVVATMKTGFSAPGGEASLIGAQYGRREASAQWGGNTGELGAYVALRAIEDDGWRAFSASRLRQGYGGLDARLGKLTLALTATLADNHLEGESATPAQELAIKRALVFTSPQDNIDRLAFVTLGGAYAATDAVSIDGNLFLRRFTQSARNGNTTSYEACAAPAERGLLCQGDGVTPVLGTGGAPLPDISDGGARPIGENDAQRIASLGLGGSLQASWSGPVLGRANQFTAGGAIDRAATDFSSSAEVGTVDAALQVAASGLFVDTPENTAFTATPVSLRAVTSDYGLFATDTFTPASGWSVTASGRYNLQQVNLADRLGDNLSGAARYGRFNPAIGAAWAATRGVTVYAGYAEGARAPSPSEIECSNPKLPCVLPSSLSSDPPNLKQVVSHTWEAGLRGHASMGGADAGRLTWSAGVFRADVVDDIWPVATSLSAGFYENVGGTRRQGIELSARYSDARLTAWASYSLVDATFRTALTLPSPSNPFADAAGDIEVRPGDRLPGIPRRRFKLGADYAVLPHWRLGASLAVVGDQIYRGDESNQLAPLPGYAVLAVRASVDLGRRIELLAGVDNALDARYATFGVLGDPTGVGAPGVPNGPGANPRFQSPAAPRTVWAGVKARF